MTKAAFILICLFSSVVTAATPRALSCQQRHCLAVVDAGSTGSRLHIYAYDVDDHNTPIQIDEIWVKKIKPGLASVEATPKAIDAYLTTLFADAPESNFPIYFYATGGMRLLSNPLQQSYYQHIKQWLDTQTQSVLLEAKTISGTQEGLFGWLAVNYKLGSLQSIDKPLVGVMDMGGASVQVSFPVEHINSVDPHDLIHVNIYQRDITLFSHSFLGLGQTEVSHQFSTEASCFSNEYPLSNELFGQGNAITCQHAISKLVNSVHQVDGLVKTVIAENPGSTWYTISGLSSLVKESHLSFKNNQFSNQDLLQQANSQFCQQSWQTLSLTGNEYAFVNCLTASYYYGLIVNGYGIAPNQPINYMPDDSEPDWTLGVVLNSKTTL